MKGKKIISGLAVMLALLTANTSVYSQTVSTQKECLKENTFLQVDSPWRPTLDERSDVAIIYGASDYHNITFKDRVQSWRDHGYITHFMTGTTWGSSYIDYFYGKWDGKHHLDEAQMSENGDTIWHSKKSPYFVPTENFLKYFREMNIKKAIDAGIESIYMEEPEFFSYAGYNEAFKNEWKKYYGTDWQPQDSSPSAAYMSQKLKHFLTSRALEESFAYAKEYGKNKGMDIKCYVATHSLLNYSQWVMISPEVSLAFMPDVDGFQCQTWTGTAREVNFFNGVAKERVLETAYLEYGSMVPLAELSGKKLTFNIDPIEDRPRNWSDYKKNYEANFVAYLLYPQINNFEVMPWPSRIFEGNFPISLDSDIKEKIPRYYSTQMLVMINACNNMPLTKNKLSGSEGISILMSNSLMFERRPVFDGYNDYPPIDRYPNDKIAYTSPTLSFSDFYGMALPLVKRGVPVKILHLENVSYPQAWKDTKLLIMTYSNMKPLSEEYHNCIAKWVYDGGVLIYCSRDEDPYQNVKEWWNTGNNHYKAPSENLFEKMNIKPDSSGEYRYGKGTVYIFRQDPKEFVLTSGKDQQFINAVKRLYDKVPGNKSLCFKNSFFLERGPYDLIAVLDESVSQKPYTQKGHLVDLFDPELPVLSEKTVSPGENACLFNIDRVKNKIIPQVLVTSARVYNENIQSHSYSFIARSPSNTSAVMRILLPAAPVECSLKNNDGKELSGASWQWNQESKTCLIKFENDPEGVAVEIKW
jgi:hypothetical protein